MWKLNMCPSLYHYRVINEPFLLKQLFMRPSVAITQGLFIKGSQKENTWKMRQWAYLSSWATNKKLRTLSFLQLLKFENINCTYIFCLWPRSRDIGSFFLMDICAGRCSILTFMGFKLRDLFCANSGFWYIKPWIQYFLSSAFYNHKDNGGILHELSYFSNIIDDIVVRNTIKL